MSGKELRRAAQKNNVEDVTSLLSQGVEIDAVDSDENTALLLAAERGSVEACSVLLHHGANIVAKNNEGRTATELAREFNK